MTPINWAVIVISLFYIGKIINDLYNAYDKKAGEKLVRKSLAKLELDPGTVWLHEKSKGLYTILVVSNRHASKKGWPIYITYVCANGRIYTRPGYEFIRKFTLHSKYIHERTNSIVSMEKVTEQDRRGLALPTIGSKWEFKVQEDDKPFTTLFDEYPETDSAVTIESVANLKRPMFCRVNMRNEHGDLISLSTFNFNRLYQQLHNGSTDTVNLTDEQFRLVNHLYRIAGTVVVSDVLPGEVRFFTGHRSIIVQVEDSSQFNVGMVYEVCSKFLKRKEQNEHVSAT